MRWRVRFIQDCDCFEPDSRVITEFYSEERPAITSIGLLMPRCGRCRRSHKLHDIAEGEFFDTFEGEGSRHGR